MMYHVVLDSQQTLDVISHEQLDIALALGAKELFNGSEKECNSYYDDFCDEFGYTGPIWDKLEINQ